MKEKRFVEFTSEFRNRFVKTLQGKDYILYGGLLQLAQEKGLKRVDVEVVQVPNQENGMLAVARAQIETDDGVFSDVGDASPASVAHAIQPHLLRMAATRAKARAMRDAVGTDMVALEEMVPDDVEIADRSPLDVRSYPVGFGRYANRTLGEIRDLDPGYVQWLSENARDPSLREAARSLVLRESSSESEEESPTETH